MDAVTHPPVPVNEPVLDYAPGSAERASLITALEAVGGTVELGAVIGGVNRRPSGKPFDVVAPFDHQRVLATSADSTREDAVAYSLLGPIARAAGVGYDVRKAFPYLGYETYEFAVPTATDGDVFARYTVRVAEMRESMKLCRQALDRITPTGPHAIDDPRITPPPKDRVYTEMEALIQHFLIYSQGFTVPAGEAYVPVEGPRGEQGFSVVSDGTNRPWRVKSRAPSLLACQALERMIIGGLIADVIAVIGSIDVVMGDVDR